MVEVVGAGRDSRHGYFGTGKRLRDRRDHLLAQRVKGREGRLVVAVSGDREVDSRHRLVRVHADREGREQLAAGQCPLPEEVVGALHLRRVDVRGLDDDHGRGLRTGKGVLEPVVGAHDREIVGKVGQVRQLGVHPEGGQGQDQQRPGRDEHRRPGPTQNSGDEVRPSPVVARTAAEERNPAPVDVVAQPGQHRREHRQGPDHRRQDHDHRPEPDRGEQRVPRDEHPRHRDQHRRTRDQDRLPRSTCSHEQGLMRGTTLAALLPLPPQIEERVVDPDRHPDHQDDRAQRLRIGRQHVADETVQPGRGQHRGEGQDHGETGGDERAERNDQDRDRQRQRDQLDPAHVALEPLTDLVVRRGLPELLHDHARVGRLDSRDRRQDRRDLVLRLVGRALHVELNEHRAAITRDQAGVRMLDRRDDGGHVWLTGERLHHAADRCRELRLLIDRPRPRLHQHALTRRDLEVPLIEDLLSTSRVPVRDRPALHLADANRATDYHSGDRKRDPAERRRLPVRGAPTPRPAREIRAAHHQDLPRQARPQHRPVRRAPHRGKLPTIPGKSPIFPAAHPGVPHGVIGSTAATMAGSLVVV